jgi:hypothetical protein
MKPVTIAGPVWWPVPLEQIRTVLPIVLTHGNQQNAFFAGIARPFVLSRRSLLNLQYPQEKIHEKIFRQHNLSLA